LVAAGKACNNKTDEAQPRPLRRSYSEASSPRWRSGLAKRTQNTLLFYCDIKAIDMVLDFLASPI